MGESDFSDIDKQQKKVISWMQNSIQTINPVLA